MAKIGSRKIRCLTGELSEPDEETDKEPLPKALEILWHLLQTNKLEGCDDDDASEEDYWFTRSCVKMGLR